MSGPRWLKEKKRFAAELKRQLLYLSSFKIKGKKKKAMVGGTVNHRLFQTFCSDYEEKISSGKILGFVTQVRQIYMEMI